MQIAILIHSYGAVRADADNSFGPILQIDAYATVLGLNVDEGDVVLLGHRVRHATYLNLDLAIIQMLNHRDVLLAATVRGVGHKLLHRLAAAYHINTRIHHLLDHIAAMAALIKLCCHNQIVFIERCKFRAKSVPRALVALAVGTATLARVEDEAQKVAIDNSVDIALAASNDLYVVRLKLRACALAHTAGEHHLHAHLLQVGGNARLTAATLR